MNSKIPANTAKVEWARKRLRIIGVFVIILLVINFGYQMWKRYGQNTSGMTHTTCDLLEKFCEVIIKDQGSVRLTLEPKPIAANIPLSFIVNVVDIPVEEVRLMKLPSGTDPFIDLIPMEKVNGNSYIAKGIILPKMDANESHWVVLVQVIQDEQTISVPFRIPVPGYAFDGK